MAWRRLTRPRLNRCRPTLLALLLALGGLAFDDRCAAAADTRTETLRILVRAKSAIETGVTARDFAALLRQLDEQIEIVRLTKSQDLTPAQLEAATAALKHLREIALLWSHLNEQSHCQDQYGFYDVIQDRSCRARLVELLLRLGLQLTDVSRDESSVHRQQILQAALNAAHQQLTNAIGKFAAR